MRSLRGGGCQRPAAPASFGGGPHCSLRAPASGGPKRGRRRRRADAPHRARGSAVRPSPRGASRAHVTHQPHHSNLNEMDGVLSGSCPSLVRVLSDPSVGTGWPRRARKHGTHPLPSPGSGDSGPGSCRTHGGHGPLAICGPDSAVACSGPIVAPRRFTTILECHLEWEFVCKVFSLSSLITNNVLR